MTIAQKLKEIRENLGLSQESFGNSLGVSFQTVYKWEKGEMLPGAQNLKKIRDLYDVDINEVLSCN